MARPMGLYMETITLWDVPWEYLIQFDLGLGFMDILWDCGYPQAVPYRTSTMPWDMPYVSSMGHSRGRPIGRSIGCSMGRLVGHLMGSMG